MKKSIMLSILGICASGMLLAQNGRGNERAQENKRYAVVVYDFNQTIYCNDVQVERIPDHVKIKMRDNHGFRVKNGINSGMENGGSNVREVQRYNGILIYAEFTSGDGWEIDCDPREDVKCAKVVNYTRAKFY